MQSPYTHIHLIGLGGIHVSAIAKLLLSLGVSVSGSDLAENEVTQELRERGVNVVIGHAPQNVPAEAQAIVFSSAANETNPERKEGMRRELPMFNSHQFLGVLGASMDQIIVTGTHGKSTTTAMMAVMAKACGLEPTVVVGTRVPQLTDGNVEIPEAHTESQWLIAEGDEFDHHFLAYAPRVLVINNIEGDHFDIYPTIEAMLEAYRQLLKRVVKKGWVIANGDDPLVRSLIEETRADLEAREIIVNLIGKSEDSVIIVRGRDVQSGTQIIHLQSKDLHQEIDLTLTIPGEMNAMNAVMCYAAGEAIGLPQEKAVESLTSFQGIWRRLEKIGEKKGVTVFSDYGHHPTAVTKTLEAVKEFYPDRRIVLCFQPHHRNRTKHLFKEFTTCFDLANVLVLTEIYDVKGRDQSVDETVSSKALIQAIEQRNGERNIDQTISYAANPDEALRLLKKTLKSNDVLIVMGAGDIYPIAYALV